MGLLVNMVKRYYEKKAARENEQAAAPAPGDRIVFYIPGSSVYHLDDWCLDGSAKDPIKAKEKQAIKMGLRLCKRCEKNI